MEKAASRTQRLTYIALCVALMALCSWIAIPALVPFTLQTFAVFAALSLLGGRLGTAAIACYLGLGFAGLPVFANFTGGPGILLGATGGYLIGFLVMGLIYWLLTALFGEGKVIRTAALLSGLLLLYAFGSVWFLLFYVEPGGMTLGGVLAYCVLPFVAPDLIKLALALLITERVRRQIHI